MKQNQKIAVIGGGGRTGSYLVNQLLNQGYQLKLLLRSPEHLKIQSRNAADIAEFMILQLNDDAYIRKAPFISN